MRTFFMAVGAAMSLPLIILNWGAAIVGGIWLAVLGHWALIIGGVIALFLLPIGLPFALMPGYSLAALSLKGPEVLQYPALAISFLWSLVVVTTLSIVIFFNVLRPHEGNVWPYILWAYAIATTPWVSAGREELRETGTIMWVSAAQFGSMGLMYFVLSTRAPYNAPPMLWYFLPPALAGMAMAIFLRQNRRRY